MVVYECPTCGDWLITKSEAIKHMIQKHDTSDKEDVLFSVWYQDKGRKGGYQSKVRKWITIDTKKINKLKKAR